MVPAVPYTRMMELLNQATIGIAPMLGLHKHRIGLPTKMIEYMAAGLPVVTSDLPIKREIVNETKAGLLAKPGDVESFADAIRTLVDDRSYARVLGENGRRAVWDSYCWETQMAALLSFYDELLAEEAARAGSSATEPERSAGACGGFEYDSKRITGTGGGDPC